MEKHIYIKTEPGGKASFGSMSDHDIMKLCDSAANGTLSKDILYKLKRGVGGYNAIHGVVNHGDDGDHGNEGIIKLDDDGFVVPNGSDGGYIKGYYAVYLSLSKVSVEFNVSCKGEDAYDPLMLVEKSVRVDLPDCVRHEWYSDLRFNVVVDYEYNGRVIKDANKELIDRGYQDSISIFSAEKNEIIPLYDFVGGVEIFY